jgi:hypothetical protein
MVKQEVEGFKPEVWGAAVEQGTSEGADTAASFLLQQQRWTYVHCCAMRSLHKAW